MKHSSCMLLSAEENVLNSSNIDVRRYKIPTYNSFIRVPNTGEHDWFRRYSQNNN